MMIAPIGVNFSPAVILSAAKDLSLSAFHMERTGNILLSS